ncbi:lipopolysaccharide biosynthesis protein [Spirosoma pomorum]
MKLLSINIGKRVNNRERKFLSTIVSSLFTKGVNIFASVITLPLILNSIGKERYGMMVAITSVSALISFADFGLGFGLQSKIPELVKKKDNSLQEAVSSTFYFLLFVSIIILCVSLPLLRTIDWGSSLNLSSATAINESLDSVLIYTLCLLIVIPFSVVQKLQIGLQEGYYTNLWIALGNFTGVLLILLYYKANPSTPEIILFLYGTNSVFVLLNFFYEFVYKKKNLIPSITKVRVSVIKAIVTESSLFFLVQMLGLLVFMSNNYFLIFFFGPEEVASFNIAFKLTALFLIPLEAIAPYLTPAINEALVSGDTDWIKRSTKKVIYLTLAFATVSSLLIYVLGNFILSIWVGEGNILNDKTLLAASGYILLYSSLGSILSYIMLSTNFIRIKAAIYTIAVVLTLTSKFYFVKQFGMLGAFWSTTIPMFILYIVPCIYIMKRRKMF